MVYKQFDKVLDLAAKTGDKVIVMSDNHEPYVVMAVKDYEGLIQDYSSVKDLTEEELLDKINRDIAVWKASQENGDDYDLSQFRVDSLKKEDAPISDNANFIQGPALKKKEEAPSLSEDKKDIPNTNEEDKYYIEPVS